MRTNSFKTIIFIILLSLFTGCKTEVLLDPTITSTPTIMFTPTITHTITYTYTLTMTNTHTPIPIIGKWDIYTRWDNSSYIKSQIEFFSDNTVIAQETSGMKFTYSGSWSYSDENEWDIEMMLIGGFFTVKFSGKFIEINRIEGECENSSGQKGDWYAERL